MLGRKIEEGYARALHHCARHAEVSPEPEGRKPRAWAPWGWWCGGRSGAGSGAQAIHWSGSYLAGDQVLSWFQYQLRNVWLPLALFSGQDSGPMAVMAYSLRQQGSGWGRGRGGSGCMGRKEGHRTPSECAGRTSCPSCSHAHALVSPRAGSVGRWRGVQAGCGASPLLDGGGVGPAVVGADGGPWGGGGPADQQRGAEGGDFHPA